MKGTHCACTVEVSAVAICPFRRVDGGYTEVGGS